MLAAHVHIPGPESREPYEKNRIVAIIDEAQACTTEKAIRPSFGKTSGEIRGTVKAWRPFRDAVGPS